MRALRFYRAEEICIGRCSTALHPLDPRAGGVPAVLHDVILENLQDCNRPARPLICCGFHSQKHLLLAKTILYCSPRWWSDAVTCWLCEQFGLILADGTPADAIAQVADIDASWVRGTSFKKSVMNFQRAQTCCS